MVAGLRRSAKGPVDAEFVARRLRDGSSAGAGSVEIGLRIGLAGELGQRLAYLPARRRGAMTRYPGHVAVVAAACTNSVMVRSGTPW